MPRPEPLPQLDQTLNFSLWEELTEAKRYEDYLEAYYKNYEKRKPEWDDHFGHVRKATMQYLVKYLEITKKNRDEIVIATLGAGSRPKDFDYGDIIINTMFAEARGVIVIDHSMDICREACKSILHKENLVQRERVQGVQADLSQGMVEGYGRLLAEEIGTPANEEEFLAALHRLQENFLLKVRGKVDDLVQQHKRQQKRPKRRRKREGQLEEEDLDPFEITIDDKPVEVDVYSANSLYAGMGAAVEHAYIWTPLYDSIRNADEKASPSPKTLENRKKIFTIIHKIITMFNTEVAYLLHKQIFDKNPRAMMIGVTDVATTYGDFAEYPRLDVCPLQQRLSAELGISLAVSKTRKWDFLDEGPHSHPENVLIGYKDLPVDDEMRLDLQIPATAEIAGPTSEQRFTTDDALPPGQPSENAASVS